MRFLVLGLQMKRPFENIQRKFLIDRNSNFNIETFKFLKFAFATIWTFILYLHHFLGEIRTFHLGAKFSRNRSFQINSTIHSETQFFFLKKFNSDFHDKTHSLGSFNSIKISSNNCALDSKHHNWQLRGRKKHLFYSYRFSNKSVRRKSRYRCGKNHPIFFFRSTENIIKHLFANFYKFRQHRIEQSTFYANKLLVQTDSCIYFDSCTHTAAEASQPDAEAERNHSTIWLSFCCLSPVLARLRKGSERCASRDVLIELWKSRFFYVPPLRGANAGKNDKNFNVLLFSLWYWQWRQKKLSTSFRVSTWKTNDTARF